MSETGFVLQPWVASVGLKMQSILLSGLRAPDAKTSAVKKCVRWMRGNCQKDADPQKQSYMQTITMTDEMIDAAMDELEYLPVHYVHHFADSFRVMALFHPDKTVRASAYRIHYLVAEELFHFKPETDVEFLERHKDKVSSVPANMISVTLIVNGHESKVDAYFNEPMVQVFTKAFPDEQKGYYEFRNMDGVLLEGWRSVSDLVKSSQGKTRFFINPPVGFGG